MRKPINGFKRLNCLPSLLQESFSRFYPALRRVKKPKGKLLYLNLWGKVKLALFVLILSNFNTSFASVNFDNPYLENNPELSYLYDNCSNIATMKTLKVKKNHSNANSSMFSYNYSHVEAAKNQTTIIYLPGGPGGGSIQMFDGSDFFPNNMNRILIDPRGTDCNFFDPKDFDFDSITSVQTAKDIVEVIKQEKLTDYILFGQSYGTLLGTVLAHLIHEDRTSPQPKALILEGVIGHHYLNDGSEYYQNHVDIVNQLLNDNPKIKKLFSDPSTDVMGFNLDDWANYFITIPPTGINEKFGAWPLMVAAEPYLTSNSDIPESIASEMESYLEFEMGMQEVQSQIYAHNEGLDFLGLTILCREISPEVPWVYDNIFFENGNLVLDKTPSEQVSCGQIKMDRPFDSKNFPTAAPTVYIQGTHDAQTPLRWAKYHYSNSQSRLKKFIQVEGGGHSPSYFELNDCFDQILNVVDLDPHLDFSKLLNTDGQCRKQSPIRRRQQPRKDRRRQVF